MMVFFPRLVAAALSAAVLLSSPLAFGQSGELRPPEQQPGADAGKNAQKTDELAEAAAAVNGPAGNAECVWLGRRVVRLLWGDDLDTAFRHLDLYDRFGCPSSHVQAAFRCVVMQGPFENKSAETLNSRVHGCWIKPGTVTPADSPAATTAKSPRR